MIVVMVEATVWVMMARTKDERKRRIRDSGENVGRERRMKLIGEWKNDTENIQLEKEKNELKDDGTKWRMSKRKRKRNRKRRHKLCWRNRRRRRRRMNEWIKCRTKKMYILIIAIIKKRLEIQIRCYKNKHIKMRGHWIVFDLTPFFTNFFFYSENIYGQPEILKQNTANGIA